jgi:hypothetical protein
VGPADNPRLSANRTREGDHVDPACPALPQRRGSRRGGRAAGVDVVHQGHAGGCRRDRPEAAADVRPALGEREPSLLTGRTGPLEERQHRELPVRLERASQPFGRVVTALQRPVGVRWDEGDRVCAGSRDDVGHERARVLGEPAEPMLLPGGDERLRSEVVRDGRARGGEREPPALTLTTARDGPRRRRTAPPAARPAQAPKPCETRFADRTGRRAAHDAATRNQEIEQEIHTAPTLPGQNARVCADSVSTLCRAG